MLLIEWMVFPLSFLTFQLQTSGQMLIKLLACIPFFFLYQSRSNSLIFYRLIPMAHFKSKCILFYYFSAAYSIVTDDIQTQVVSDLTKLFGHVLSYHPSVKRNSFPDAMSSLGLANLLQPHVKAVQQVVFYITCYDTVTVKQDKLIIGSLLCFF